MKNYFTGEDVEEIESLWKERYNTLIQATIDYCKDYQKHEQKNLDYDWVTRSNNPIVHVLDNVILELRKRKI